MNGFIVCLLSLGVFIQSDCIRKRYTTIQSQHDSIMPSENVIISLEYRVSVPPFLKEEYLSEGISPSHKVAISQYIPSIISTEINTVEDPSSTVLCRMMSSYYRIFLLYQLIQNPRNHQFLKRIT